MALRHGIRPGLARTAPNSITSPAHAPSPNPVLGPYRTPVFQYGDDAFCERFGDCIVVGLHDARIPWPVGKRRGKSERARFIILCGDLVKAVRRESEKAVAYWWGVGPFTACQWRKALGVPTTNEGTIPDADVPQAVEPVFQHVVTTYASEANKTASVWRAVPDALPDFKPHAKVNSIRTILVHQLLSERRFLAEFMGLEEPPVEELLPHGEKPAVKSYIEKYVVLAKRLPQFAQGTTAWWLEERQFFGGLKRERIWVF